MLMDTIVKDIKTLANSSIIKIDAIAKQYETLETIANSDAYIAASQKTDRFDLYTTFDIDVIGDAFRDVNGDITISEELQFEYANKPYLIPIIYRDKVLDIQRQYIIRDYVEINNYYRMLSGLPNIETEERYFIKLTSDEQKRADIMNDSYIHEMSNDEIYKIEECGLLAELIEKYPKYKYLKYLGHNGVDIITARITNNFGILKLTYTDIPDYFYNKFLQTYEECRQYFMTIIYVQNFSNTYKLYDNFIGLCIMFMTIQRIVSNTFKFGIEREFYDWSFIQNLYKMYNVPFVNNLPIEYHITILKNLNNLLRYKSTDKVLYDIATLLGYERINIFKYYLVKKHVLDENEEPIFYYKQKIDEEGNPVFDDNGKPVLIEDLERMYEIYFQKVDIKEQNLALALQDDAYKLNYNEVVSEDPYWYEDEDLVKKKYNEAYNYIETKYISLNLMYKMSEMLFEITYGFRMLIDKKNELEDIRISIPKIYMDAEFKLFDIVIFMIALMCKLHGFKDGLITTPSKISHIYSFDFNETSINAIKSIILDNKRIIDPEIVQYFENLTITEASDVNNLFVKIRDYNNFIVDKMRKSTNIKEYHMYKDIFKISMVSETQTDMFKIVKYNDKGRMVGETVATTYLEYLEYASPILAQIVKTSSKDDIPVMMDHITSVINDLIESMQYLFIINDNNNPVFTALLSLIKFFKSYTVDLHGFNVIYLFDSKFYNMMKMIEDIHSVDAHIKIDRSFNQLYSDDTYGLHVSLGDYKDKYHFYNEYNSELSISLYDRDTVVSKDELDYMNKIMSISSSLDHPYSSETLINNTTVYKKDKYRMKDSVILKWE